MNLLTDLVQKRSQFLQEVRAFFYDRGVAEADVNLLVPQGVVDAHLQAFSVCHQGQVQGYLHTSPELALKKLLMLGSGDIFYLGSVFRAGDQSTRHRAEFCMLEWYRTGWDWLDLAQETLTLIQQFLKAPVHQLTYGEAFFEATGLDPFTDYENFAAYYQQQKLPPVDLAVDDYQAWRSLLWAEKVEKNLKGLTLISHFPADEASLAEVDETNSRVVKRFEVYYENLELANGYQELTDFKEHRHRFDTQNRLRKTLGLAPVLLDEGFFTLLKQPGLVKTAGVALGIDRLMMAAWDESSIEAVQWPLWQVGVGGY